MIIYGGARWAGMATDLETVNVAFDESTGVGTLTLNRPDKLNTLNQQLREDLVAGLEALEGENEGADGVALRVVILEGAGDRAFCAGADVTEFSEASPGESSERSYGEFIREFPAPIIAKIQGYCLGGGLELAFACDLRFASEDSTFGLPETGLGIIPGAGGIQYLVRLAGPAVAKELVMEGEHFSAKRAADAGLVNDVYPTDELDAEVEAFAEQISGQAPLAIQATKESVAVAQQVGLEEGLAYDNRVATELLETEDAEEGQAAFAEDREPEFDGK